MPRGTSRYDEAQLQGRLWSPLSLRPALWLDAADLSTVTVSTGVSEWRDKSGNARHATQGTASNQPTLSEFDAGGGFPSGATNTGLPVVRFDGAGDHLLLPTGFLNGATAVTVAMLMRSAGGGNNGVFGPSNAFNNGLEIIQVNNTTLRTNGTTRIQSGLFSSNNGYGITTIQGSSSATSAEFNGAAVTPENGGGISALAFNGVYSIGMYFGTGFSASMRLCEFVVFLDSLFVPDRQKIQGYIAWKWAISHLLPSSHPFANRPPLTGD